MTASVGIREFRAGLADYIDAAEPKSIDITSHQPYLDAIVDELNDRPRAVLGFLTSREVFTNLLNDDVALTS